MQAATSEWPLFIRAMFQNRAASDLVTPHAVAVAKGEADSLPEELADLFTMELVTLPDGTTRWILDFA